VFDRIVDHLNDESFDNPEHVRHYAAHMEKFAGMYKDFIAHLKTLAPGKRLLEVGAGTGMLTWRVAGLFPDARITALELSPHMAEFGREYVAEKGYADQVTYVVGNAEDADFVAELGKFDLVYSSLVLHEFSDARRTLPLLYNAVADNGTLAILDLRRAWWLYWIPSKEGFFKSIRASFLPGELRTMFSELGIANPDVRQLFPFLMVATVRR